MQIERRDIESNLPSKGFVREDSNHRYFYHEYRGKRTGAYTYTSHGSGYKTYGISLIKMMKTQLRLNNNKQVFNLCTCPISEEDYNKILIANNVFKPE
jgi:hypothetical protein